MILNRRRLWPGGRQRQHHALGQLIQVNDRSDTRAGADGSTWVFSYDQGGNILSKKLYPYANTSGTPIATTTFTYSDPNWRDKLTAVNGVAITYDAIGNPLNDGIWTYTWQNGRQLAGMSNGTTTASFVYNKDGLRVQKTVNGVVTHYTLHGKNVVHMTRGSDDLHFFYDAQNRPAVVVYNGTAYAYIKNLQGDIVGIMDQSGNAVVEYTYDAWGNPTSKTGSMASTLGVLNPFRYRGYVYDEETGLYYLRNRYYNGNIGRFLNADIMIGVTGRVCSHNLFSYGANTVISVADYDGKSIIMITDDDNLSHTSLLIRDFFGGWHYLYWGANPETAEVSLQVGTCSVQCKVSGSAALVINAINNQPGNGILIYENVFFDHYLDNDQDTLTSINAFLNASGLYDYTYDRMVYFELPTICSGIADLYAGSLKRNQSELTYNLLTYNCAQLCLEVLGYALALDNLHDLEAMKEQLTSYGRYILPKLIHMRIDADDYYND